MSSNQVANPDPPGLLSDSSHFSNPEDIAVRLTQIKQRHKHRRPAQVLPSNCDRLLGILREISLFPDHRHRRDAANIIDQVNARMRRGTVQRLVADPMRFPRNEDPGVSLSPSADDPLPVVQGTLPPDRPPGEPIPDVSVRRIHPKIAGAGPAPPPRNQDLVDAGFRWIPDDEDFMIAMENLRSMGADDPGLHAPLLVDHPLEIVMEFWDDIPLITAPLPQVDPALQTATRTPLTIYDTRAWSQGTRGAINADHYIYRLIDLCRTKLLHPSVAAKYAIVNRAHPSRYRAGSKDNIADEPPASINEIEGVMRWVLHGFPVIEILSAGFTQDGRVDIGDVCGYILRDSRHSHKLFLNALFFNTIEQAYREGEDYDAIVFLLFVTVAHEFGHYLNTCWHIGADHRTTFGTPRGLRYLVQSAPREDREHPDYDPEDMVCGEIGQILEWLILGFMAGVVLEEDSTTWVGQSLRLMQTRPHLRLRAHELRVFAENLRREESEEINPADLSDDNEEVTIAGGSRRRRIHEPGTFSPEPEVSPENPRREEELGDTGQWSPGDGYVESIALGEAPDVDAERSGVSIPNTPRGKAFRHSFICLEREIERARARRRARGRPNRAISCGLGEIDGLGSGPTVRFRNNIGWRTDEIPPLPSAFLSFLTNFDNRIIIVGVRLLPEENISGIHVGILFDIYSSHNSSGAVLGGYPWFLNRGAR
ncbi:hypothetical protein HOY82DRAFT_536298 [Tuber indicum]|nr:hypothetical protein HOY82DRAFT_536298 [Tuber indicum]